MVLVSQNFNWTKNENKLNTSPSMWSMWRKGTFLVLLINFTTSLIPEAITEMKTVLILLSILGMACALSVSSLLKTYSYFHFLSFDIKERIYSNWLLF